MKKRPENVHERQISFEFQSQLNETADHISIVLLHTFEFICDVCTPIHELKLIFGYFSFEIYVH